jgi:Zn-dependent peptidase ImmA (M78 family)
VEVAEKIRRTIGFDLEARHKMPTWTDALRAFIGQADNAGILVMVSGVVGSNNRRKLDPQEFRGFALSDDLAPLVFINGADTKAAQMFTLAHELAHIWIAQSALSDAGVSTLPDRETERWCNQVAAEFLVPMEMFKQQFNRHADLRDELDRLARQFKVSTLVVLRRMHDAGALETDRYWAAFQEELKRLKKAAKGSGGDFYLTLGARVGKRFARALVISTMEGRSSFSEALRLLSFRKMATFDELGRNLGVMP